MLVLSRSEDGFDHPLVLRAVTFTTSRLVDELVEVTVVDDRTSSVSKITTTAGHPIWTWAREGELVDVACTIADEEVGLKYVTGTDGGRKQADQGWTFATDIKPRQWVAGPTRPLGTVAGVRHIEAPGTRVYNFGVDGTRTYFVSGTTVCGQPMPVWVHNTHRRTSKAPEGTSVRVGKNGGEMPAEHAKIVAEREKRRAEQRNKKARECNGQNAQGSKKEKGQKGPSGVMPEEARKKKQEAQQRERNVGIDEEHSRRTKNNPGAGAKR